MSDETPGDPLITDDYRALNRQLHDRLSAYGANSGRWADKVLGLVDRFSAENVLDYGCGKGMLSQALPDLTVVEYDPAIEGKDRPPPPCDLVVCTDVLEHIEPELLFNVLADIARLARKAAFLNISTRLAGKRLPDGRNTHLIVQPPDWWRERLERHFSIDDWRVDDRLSEVNCVVTSKRRADEPDRRPADGL